MRGIEGMDVDIRPISGSATMTSEGYVFAGKGLQGEGGQSASTQDVSIQTEFIVPADVLNDRISIEAIATHSPNIDQKKIAVLYVTVTCLEEGVSTTNTVRVNTGLDKKRITLLPKTPLVGLDKSGNKVRVEIKRQPGVGEDIGDTSSVVLHNLEIKSQRASANTRSASSQFSTLS
jgi:hypothetical protein